MQEKHLTGVIYGDSRKEVGPKGWKSTGIRNKTSPDVVQSGRRRAVEPGKQPTNQAGVTQEDLPTGEG